MADTPRSLPDRTIPLGGSARTAPNTTPRVTLLVYHRDGVLSAELSEGSSLVIGRKSPADVIIADGRMSAQHACLAWVDGAIWLEDLQSTNGTWIGDAKVTRCVIQPGAQFRLGAITACLHETGQPDSAPIDGHDCFVGELEIELSRATAFRQTCTVAMVRHADDTHVDAWIERLRGALRPYQRIALYSNTIVEVVLPGVADRDGVSVVRTLVGQEALLAGLSAYPALSSAEALVDAARSALNDATPAAPIRCATQALSSSAGDGPNAARKRERKEPLSEAMRAVYQLVERVGPSAIAVLLCGETGVGKEVVARAIHDSSGRADQPMVCVNCGAIPAQLVESTLFGHVRGAFTGATSDAKGAFESAAAGTILLDEIGELSAPAQAALLRVLESKTLTRVGASQTIEVKARVLAATHRDLEAMAEAGTFRSDLLFRLNTMTIEVPPLRDCREDIQRLARHFLVEANSNNRCSVQSIDESAMRQLVSYRWPGNVRELRNAIERAAVLASDGVISIDDLPQRVRQSVGAASAAPEASGPTADEIDVHIQLAILKAARRHAQQPLTITDAAMAVLRQRNWGDGETIEGVLDAALSRATASGASQIDEAHLLPAAAAAEHSFHDATREFQRQLLSTALARTGWNVSAASRQLELSRSRLNELLKEFDLRRP